ncbi:MAG: hypothetical protein BWY37_01513 [Firmicutes bacterium ADurb.Bin262]|nr:MAG: hypothetical protein BWY37_01513 [Firmicutes bacterium ADurb.Bin262]
MNETAIKNGSTLRAQALDGAVAVTGAGPDGEKTLARIADGHAVNPHLFIDAAGTLHLFYTAVRCACEETSQPMHSMSKQGRYSEDFIRFGGASPLYPRLGGSFTPGDQSSGVDENDPFWSGLEQAYRSLARAAGAGAEQTERFIAEKRALALGLLFGIENEKKHCPIARRFGFTAAGAPAECLREGKSALLLPVYSVFLKCVMLMVSTDGGECFDGGGYLVCSMKPGCEAVLACGDGEIRLSLKTGDVVKPAGVTRDLGATWESLYDASDFDFDIHGGETVKSRLLNLRLGDTGPSFRFLPGRFFRLAKEVAANEQVFKRAKTRPSGPDTGFVRGRVDGLEGYGVPSVEDIFPMIREHAHGSGIAALHNGELLCVWFQSDGERRGNYGRIMAARKNPGGPWREPFVMADAPGMPDCNPTLFIDREENLWFFWYPVLANCWESSQTRFYKAPKGAYEAANGFDACPRWEKGGVLNPARADELKGKAAGFENGAYVYGEVNGECCYIDAEQFRQHPLPKRSYVKIDDRYITDRFVVAARNDMAETLKILREQRPYPGLTPFFELYLRWEAGRTCRIAAGAERTYEKWKPVMRCLGWQTKNKPLEFAYGGKTRLLLPLYSDGLHWSLTAFTDDGGETWGYGLPFGATAPEQGAGVLLSDGRLRSYFRNGEPAGHIISYESADGGETFAGMRVETQLRHEGGFDILQTAGGLWLMSVTEAAAGPPARKHNRSRLNVAVSADEGRHWTLTPLELDRNGMEDYHYSAVTQGPDGTIHISYSHDAGGLNNIRHAEIRPGG